MRAITARHSLFPRSHIHLPNSFPRGSPAIARLLAWADSWTYHVPVLAGPDVPGPVRLAPVSFPAAPATTCSLFERKQPAAYHFGQGLPAALAHLYSRGLSTVHVCCACGTCLAPHTARRLAVSIPSPSPG